jgi:capsid assembly protease
MSRRNRNRSSQSTPPVVDVRTAARAFLANEAGIGVAIRREALERIEQIASSEEPVVAPPGAFMGDNGRGARQVRAGVAVIPLQGIITPRPSFLSLLFGYGGGGLEGFRRRFRDALADEDVSAIVLDVHSPGGSVSLVPETAAELRAARGRKPIVTVCNTMAASAAYWIGAQADELVVTPSGFAGSIGVLLVHRDYSGMNADLGVAPTYITAGKYKAEANPDYPLGDEARAALQAEVDDFYRMFVDDVAAGRATTPAAVRAGYGEGRVLTAQPAVDADLVDRIATIDDVVRDLAAGNYPATRGANASGATGTVPPVDTPRPQRDAIVVPEEVRARIDELRSLTPAP